MKHIVNFSGGKDSTAMLLMMLEKDMQIDDIIFCDTGKEFPQMYEHIEKVQDYIGRKITTLKADKSFDYYMFDHIKSRGKHTDIAGYGWATMRIRWCTNVLKRQVVNRYLKGINHVKYIGIAYDEPKRHANIDPNVIHPLYDWGITEAQALQYCYDKGFTWGGLYEHLDRVSCWCCPLKNQKELKAMYKFYPDLWEKLKDMDNRAWNKFHDKGVQYFEDKFLAEEQQIPLFNVDGN